MGFFSKNDIICAYKICSMEDYKLLGLEEKEYLTYKLLVEKGDLTQAQIARGLGFSKPTARRMCDQLIKKGWIKPLDLGDETIYKSLDPITMKKKNIEGTEEIFSVLERLFSEKQGIPKVRIIDNKKDFQEIAEEYSKLPITHIFSKKGIVIRNNNKRYVFKIKNSESHVNNFIDIGDDSVYFSNSFEFPFGILIRNKDIANTLRFMIQTIIEKK